MITQAPQAKIPLPTDDADAPGPMPPLYTMSGVAIPVKRWTRDEYQTIFNAGLLGDGKHYELLEGLIVEKMPQGRKHALSILQCQEWLEGVFGKRHVQSQMPSVSDKNGEPEPDVAVFAKRWQEYEDSPPASEARLFVEVTNTTQTEDRQIKRRMYARAGVPDYWILDVNRRTLTVHRSPLGDDYASITTLTEAQTVLPLAAPDTTAPVVVADLLAPNDSAQPLTDTAQM